MTKRIAGALIRASTALALAAVVLATSAPAMADGDAHPRPGLELGGRAAYFRSPDENNRQLFGGAQLRLHFSDAVAVEGSADYRRAHFGGGFDADVYPIQASLLAYLAPSSPVSPFLLGGYGWYRTHLTGPAGVGSTNQDRHGPHAGAGVQFFFNGHWSVDGTWRYMWLSDVNAPANPVNQHFNGNGWMATAGLNYHF